MDYSCFYSPPDQQNISKTEKNRKWNIICNNILIANLKYYRGEQPEYRWRCRRKYNIFSSSIPSETLYHIWLSGSSNNL